jgi:hypothetical protein
VTLGSSPSDPRAPKTRRPARRPARDRPPLTRAPPARPPRAPKTLSPSHPSDPPRRDERWGATFRCSQQSRRFLEPARRRRKRGPKPSGVCSSARTGVATGSAARSAGRRLSPLSPGSVNPSKSVGQARRPGRTARRPPVPGSSRRWGRWMWRGPRSNSSPPPSSWRDAARRRPQPMTRRDAAMQESSRSRRAGGAQPRCERGGPWTPGLRLHRICVGSRTGDRARFPSQKVPIQEARHASSFAAGRAAGGKPT